jgi:sterol desaturase/sphingolipid hydroxylase (fatty acid hydroxylase superfamily)
MLVLVDDIVFYWVHRTLHTNKTLYRLIHKKHHEAFAPVPAEYLYVHPLEWMIGSAGPVAGVALVLGIWGEMSAWTFWLWGAFRTLHELDIHSGIRSSWARAIPLYGVMEHHDRHHAKPTLGNYASTLTLWDKVFQTEIPPAEPRSPA